MPRARPQHLILVALALLAAVAQTARAQTPPPIPTARALSGRLPDTPQLGDVTLTASRGTIWPETAPGDPNATPTQRLLLTGDVTATLGLHRFTAVKAVVWLQPIKLADDTDAHQVAIYFDRVEDPGAVTGIAHAADRLLVTGILTGDVTLQTDLTKRGRPADAFLREAERRFGRHLADLGLAVTDVPADVREPRFTGQPDDRLVPGFTRPFEVDSPFNADLPDAPTRPAPYLRTPPIFGKKGRIAFAPGTDAPPIKVKPTDDANLLIIMGGVTVQHTDPNADRSLQISAQRAVVFLEPGPVTEVFSHLAESVLGIYVEGDVVATDGQYTIRGPRVYYDVPNNTATIVDAVFWTYDEARSLPLYVRAASLKQLAANKFNAREARLSTSTFFDPHFSVGAKDITVTRAPREAGGETRTHLQAEDFTIEAMNLPVFWYPSFNGDLEDIPLRDIRVENSSVSGTAIKTTWDLAGLLGLDAPPGIDIDLLLDGYFDRGVGFGLDTSWNRDGHAGNILAYTLANDDGTDQLTSGARIERDGEWRGILLGHERFRVDDNWLVQLEGSYISDEAFLDTFFEGLAETAYELTNRAHVEYRDDNSVFSVVAKGDFNDFTANEYLLQSQGYTVERLPEVTYTRIADDVLTADGAGLMTYSSEYRYSRMRFNFNEPFLREFGFDTPGRAMAGFGLAPGDRISDALRAAGLTEDDVNRFDTRQELALTFNAGPVKLNPFVTGRVTTYDRKFSAFSSDADRRNRLWGAAGVRMSTSIHRIDDSVDSRLFDLHRIRHIIEPNATLWVAGTNLDQADLPVYDDRVESLASGAAARFGVDSTWQTQRGGPGRWHSVDFLKVSQHFVLSSGDTNRESPIGRFYDFRPEYSLLGSDYSITDVIWQVSDAVALSAHNTFDFDTNQNARTSAGALVNHWDGFHSYAEVRFINARDTTFVNFGTSYELTRKYDLGAHATYDTDFEEFQAIGGVIRRRFPEATFGVVINYNDITDETSFGVLFEPVGLPSDRSVRLQRLGPRQRGRSAAIGG